MVSKTFIKHVIDSFKDDLTADKVSEQLYNELKLVEDIKQGIKVANAALSDEEKRHTAKVNELNAKIKDWQVGCRHWDRTYHPDPSGNNDSYQECNACGKMF